MPKKDPKDLKYGIPSDEAAAYQAAKIKQLYYRPSIYINKELYPDVVEQLKSKKSTSDYIVSLVLADLGKTKDPE